MARFRLLLIGLTIWLIILFNLERPDITNLGNLDLDSIVYVIAAFASVTTLAFPDLAKRSEYVFAATLLLYAVAKATIGHDNTPLPLIITEVVVLLLTVAVSRIISLATANIEKAIENVLLQPEKSNVLPEAEGEEKINNELFRARRFDRPVGFVVLRVEWVEGMQEKFGDRFDLEAAFQRRYLKVRIAQIAESVIYRSDIIAWNGDNLVICLPETNREQSIRLARQIHDLLRMRLGLTITIGVAAFPDDGLIYRDLLDTALLNPITIDDKDKDKDEEPGDTGHSSAIETLIPEPKPSHETRKTAKTAFAGAPRSSLLNGLFEPLPTDFALRDHRINEVDPSNPDYWVNELPYQSASARLVYRIVKRAFDLSVVILTAPVTIPLMLVLMVLVYLDGGRPVFFVQERTGLGGRRFKMYKFRTMVPDAEEKLKELAAQGLAKLGPDGKLAEPLKLERDPRVTRIGRFLRRTSLDELPQIINVLRGDMSLVGPRPTSWGLSSYTLLHTERLTVRPGITGLWQIAARGTVDFDDWLEWDMLYIDKISLALDLQILLRTFGQVLKRKGAR
ncbi:MAG: hypothetical protein Kow0077_03260 [Anaerolineae bacterium]